MLRSVTYCSSVTVTLTLISSLSSSKMSPILFEEGFRNIVCGYILGSKSVAYCFKGHCDIDLWPQF